MTRNSSDDDSDSGDSFGHTNIKPALREAQKNEENFYNEEWPNTEGQHIVVAADIVKRLRHQSRTLNHVQNGCEENAQARPHGISRHDLAQISSTINVQDLADIIGCVKEPQVQQPQPPPLPPLQAPPPPPPPAVSQPSNMVSTT